ncbi:sensor histidine kinase [Streptomyces sp. Ac-502]|uniref:sensor histidine kinase n=1 Tax=Streptomyces sp. Ac-502 TaxID=3342801 RepID=UPI00386285A9
MLADGTVLGPATPVTDAVRLARYGRAFTYEPPSGGRTVLVPVQGVAGGTAVVLVALSESQLYAGTLASSLELAGIGVALVLLGLLVADRLGARLVGSARRLSRVADRLAAGDLAARAEPSGPPELRAVAREVNHLADRIDGFLTAERENAADLAHRLRTPVAALRLDAEGLRDPAEAERIAADVAALERSVDDIIRTAREPLRAAARRGAAGPGAAARRGASGPGPTDAGTAGPGTASAAGTQRPPCADLSAIARERADFWRPLAEDQGRELAFEAPGGPAVVRADPAGLAAAVDALIGNVFDHTPDGAGLRVTVARAVSGGCLLTVEDDGPGFPAGHVPERGRSGGGSTGLGLDIVRRSAEESGGSLECGAASGGGARVTARFGPAATDRRA